MALHPQWIAAGIRGAAALVAVAAFGISELSAVAEVRTTTATRTYTVGGSTASALVSSMRSGGIHGTAVASINPNYSLNLSTGMAGSTCRASAVTLNVRFSQTLPTARTSNMASGTRSAWNSFAAYARQHEATHKRIYIQCANNFVAKAKKMTAGNCMALQASIRRMLETDKRTCEARQRAYDRAERGRIANLSLLKMARGANRARR